MLRKRLKDAKDSLKKVDVAVVGSSSQTLPDGVKDGFRKIVSYQADIDHWITMVDARSAAWDLMHDLESKADAEGLVPFGNRRAKFVYVRLISVQAYVGTTWALADRITGMVGHILCTPDAGHNKASPAQLVTHFVQKERKKTTAGALYESLRCAFGWPAAISYAIRNHFLHEGGHIEGTDFFEAQTPQAAFRISEAGWSRVEKKAREVYGVQQDLHRARSIWPPNPRDDLREVLRACERETDDALGILVGSACGLLQNHVGLMVGDG